MASKYDPTKQNRTERTNLGIFNSKDARQRNLDSTRAIAGLTQNEQIIELLKQQNETLAHVSDMLDWFAARQHGAS